jgi:hypothetical protein
MFLLGVDAPGDGDDCRHAADAGTGGDERGQLAGPAVEQPTDALDEEDAERDSHQGQRDEERPGSDDGGQREPDAHEDDSDLE